MDCDTVKKGTTSPALLQIGISTTIPHDLGGDVFSHWVGTTEENITGPKYLGILTIGWCYVLSVRLVEMQEEDASISYTSFQADYLTDGLCYSPKTYIGNVG